MTNNAQHHFLNLVLQLRQLSLVMMNINPLVMENRVYQLKEQIEIEHFYVIQH
jgi:hypothetical protein